ncbi:MAG: response regulator [Gammaproteobacteria bacterium]|nr:response regulator [Gammaproteobacteria bacterium]
MILLVDDEPLNHAVLEAQLNQLGQTLFSADSAAQMWQLLENPQIDTLFIDLQLADDDGNLLAAALRQRYHQSQRKLRLYAYTADPDAADMGIFDGIIAKPAKRSVLESLFESPEYSGDFAVTAIASGISCHDGYLDANELVRLEADLGSDGLMQLLSLVARQLQHHAHALNATTGNRAELAAIVHRIASTAASGGLLSLSRAANAVEKRAQAGEPLFTHEFTQLLTQSLAALQRFTTVTQPE